MPSVDPRRDILPFLKGVRQTGNSWMAFCPAHDDGAKHGGRDGRSLSIKGDGLLHCFAGCEYKAIREALDCRSHERRDSAAMAPRVKAQTGGWGEPKAVYEYRDPHTRELIAVKARFERPSPDGGKPDKRFAWRLPSGDYRDGIAPLTITEMPLWGADDVLAADPERRVWFAEGESATTAIRVRNELATCGGWGASQTDFGTALEVLRGRDVILWPDNDVPGREYMRRIKQALRDIARTVAVVAAPVPPKGDAVEYFQQGGTIDALLADVLMRPTVDVVGVDHFVARVPTESGPVAFEFERMQRGRGSLDCELTVRHLSPAAEREPYTQRVNLLSQSARQGLERALAGQFGKDGMNWTTIVSTAYSRGQQAYNEQDRGVPIGQLPDQERLTFLLEPFLPLEQSTVLFGDGGSGKTYLSYAMALGVALGGSGVFGFAPKQWGGVIVIDYENPTGATMKLRFRRLLRGAGLDPVTLDELPIHYWPGMGSPLPDHVDALRRYIDKHYIRLAIVDSGAPAAPGKAEDQVVATGYFNALNALGITTLTICHITKGDNEAATRYPFGSVFWSNLARRTWFIKREQEEESDVIDLGMFCRKNNDGRYPRPVAFQLAFTADEGPVRLSKADIRDVPSLDIERGVGPRVADYLGVNGQATIAEMAEDLDIQTGSVKQVLRRGEGTLFVRFERGQNGRGNAATWGLLA